jgi:uncharacterized metal-binding protein
MLNRYGCKLIDIIGESISATKKCIENAEFKDHEKIKISDLKSIIKEKISDIENKTYDEFK